MYATGVASVFKNCGCTSSRTGKASRTPKFPFALRVRWQLTVSQTGGRRRAALGGERRLLTQQRLDTLFDAIRPDLIPGGAEVQEVGHDLFAEGAVCGQELRADVEVGHHFAVGELGDHRVRGVVLDALCVGVVRAAGEDPQEQDLRLGEPGPQLFDDGGDAVGDLFGRVRAGVVGADHDDGELGLNAVDVAVVEPPEDVLGAVAADAEVDGVTRGVGLGPNLFSGPFPALGDGVADEDQVDVPLLDPLVERFVTLHPAAVARHGGDGVMGGGIGGETDAGEAEESGGEEARATQHGGGSGEVRGTHLMVAMRVCGGKGVWECGSVGVREY